MGWGHTMIYTIEGVGSERVRGGSTWMNYTRGALG
jgi:hypothetical protein